jgi:ferrous iron transport protein A
MAAAVLEEPSLLFGAATLAQLKKGAKGRVVSVSQDDPVLRRRLIEIGFVCGERFEVVAVVWPGADPMAVRIGNSIFALRRGEAQAVQVVLEPA